MTTSKTANPGSFPDKERACFFLSALAKSDFPPSNLAHLPVVQQCEWAGWLQQQELAPFAHVVSQQSNDAFAPQARQMLTNAYWRSSGNWTIQKQALISILDKLAEAQIPVVLLKGAALAVIAYPEMAARPMGDIDLWIKRTDLEAVWQIMHELDYGTDGLWRKPAEIPSHHTQVAFYPTNARKTIVIEVMWDLIMRPGFIGQLPLVDWWQRRQIVNGYGRQIAVMDPPAMLQHVCLHQMLQHRGELRLRWLLDVDRLLRGHETFQLQPEDWALVEQESLASGILPAVQMALRTAVTYFNTPLPEAAQALLAITPPDSQQKQFQTAATPHRSTAGIMLTYVSEARGWRQKLAVITSRLFPSPEYMRHRYQFKTNLLLPFYYSRRLIKGAWMVIKRKRGRPV